MKGRVSWTPAEREARVYAKLAGLELYVGPTMYGERTVHQTTRGELVIDTGRRVFCLYPGKVPAGGWKQWRREAYCAILQLYVTFIT